eukprot:scaffold34636_cov171-Amphora_coffeaeformis.AAC.5
MSFTFLALRTTWLALPIQPRKADHPSKQVTGMRMNDPLNVLQFEAAWKEVAIRQAIISSERQSSSPSIFRQQQQQQQHHDDEIIRTTLGGQAMAPPIL